MMKIFKNIILIFLIVGMLFVLKDVYKEDNIKLINSNNENINEFENNFSVTQNKTEVSYENHLNENISTIQSIPQRYLGYEVDGVLKIPKIKLETYIFKEYSEDAMNIAPTKLWGPKINEYGNYSIIGHNYKKENMFSNLIDLEIDDKIYLRDNKNGEIEYEIYDIYKVKENNVNPIKQKSRKEMELTLITCVNYTNNRLIIKARKRTI